MPIDRLLLKNARLVRDVEASRFVERAPNALLRRIIIPGVQPAPAQEEPHDNEGLFAPSDVPHMDQQNGNLFASADNVEWYLPTFVLADDPDPSFGFTARQTTDVDQVTGEPFNICGLTLTLKKVMPPDVADFHKTSSDKVMQEVPLENLEAAVIVQTIRDGTPQETVCQATLKASAADTFVLTADGILGVNVIALYQNLTAGGTAKFKLTATYRAWRVKPRPPLPPGVMGTMILEFEVGSIPLTVSIDAGRKYEANIYRLKYTIAGGNGEPHVIVNADDLHHFNMRQTEFIELHVLGNVSARYPSIAKLYLGVVSKTVLVIPTRYVILRESAICAATCDALVDSSPGVNAGCKFNFSFTLVPDVSSIDLLLLMNDINGRPDPELHNLTFQLPKSFNFADPTQFLNIFLSSSSIMAGAADEHSLALSACIVEQPGGTPAVTNANKFINQLSATNEPFLTGVIDIELDDAFPTPVTSAILLTFKNTQMTGSTGLTLQVDEPNNAAILRNDSAFSLFVSRVALLTSQGAAVMEVAKVVPSEGIINLELPAQHADMQLLTDCEIAIGDEITKFDLFKLLQFRAIDVQNTQFMFSINAANVNFDGRGIDELGVRVILVDAPATPIPPMQVLSERRFDSTRIVLPLGTAISELRATLELIVKFTDDAKPQKELSVENDFSKHPIFLLQDADLGI